ncbi:MAG: hypothetical protein ABJA98_18485 [Acidobacteriota bacterium]
MKTVFLRVLEAEDKAAALLHAVREPERARGQQRFEVDVSSFAAVPRSPFSYWVSEVLRRRFLELSPLEAEGRTAKCGAGTLDDFRFLRLNWEPERGSCHWIPFAKGGAFGRFYSDVHLCLAWADNGAELQCFVEAKVGSATRKIQAQSWYFRPGLTWPRRTQAGLSLRVLPAGCIFADKGPAAFVENDDGDELLALLAVTNGDAFRAMVDMQMAFGSYEVGVLQRTPVPRSTDSSRSGVAKCGRRAWSLKRSLDTRTETSHAFTLPALLQRVGADVATRAVAWSEHVRTIQAELVGIQAEIDERCFALYGIDETERRAITEGFGNRGSEPAPKDTNDPEDDDAGENADENESTADATGLAAELVSWAVGVAFGRFDLRLATGARPMPTEPEPFDPLPACSPGMLAGDDGLPLARPPAGYPLALPESGILVDDPGHAQNLTTAVRAVFDLVFGSDADHWWNDVAELLDPKGHDLRVWLAGSFFEHHLKRYSKSRRKAPILWQLGTPSGRYSVWLYAHRLTRDTFFQLQNQSDGIVAQKLAHEERQLTNLIQSAGGTPSARNRKEIASQEAFVDELRALLEEVKRVAPLWNPNLDDGVVLTMAPLWRLVPQHRPWQKELKSKWDELAAGKYDWAHLAMRLWPERVVPRCATDRSLAIAHDVEDVFWVEGADGKWKARATPVRPVDELVRERSSPAVKAALKSLVDAPTAAGTSKRGRKGKADA